MSDKNKKEEPQVDPVEDFNENCKKHLSSNEKHIWLCYDCRKFTCTKCYARDHKQCWADLTENMYDEMKKTNESNRRSRFHGKKIRVLFRQQSI